MTFSKETGQTGEYTASSARPPKPDPHVPFRPSPSAFFTSAGGGSAGDVGGAQQPRPHEQQQQRGQAQGHDTGAVFVVAERPAATAAPDVTTSQSFSQPLRGEVAPQPGHTSAGSGEAVGGNLAGAAPIGGEAAGGGVIATMPGVPAYYVSGKARARAEVFTRQATLAAEMERLGLPPMIDWSPGGWPVTRFTGSKG